MRKVEEIEGFLEVRSHLGLSRNLSSEARNRGITLKFDIQGLKGHTSAQCITIILSSSQTFSNSKIFAEMVHYVTTVCLSMCVHA